MTSRLSGAPGMGKCAMRGSCGTKGWFGKPLPCPDDGPAEEPLDDETRSLLVSVCGTEFAEGPVCCTAGQLEALRDNLNQAESMISSCPACRNNFRSFFCTFTCSPDQATFLNVTSTQESQTGETAVESVDFFVGKTFASGFFDSCKSVQFGAANAYAMDLIGGGAKTYPAFLKYMGDEKPVGSPFQINYPPTSPPEYTPLDPSPRNCSDDDISSRCTCIDCPDVCRSLPFVPLPGSVPLCHVGKLSCFTFILTLSYSLAVFAFLVGYVVQSAIRRQRDRTYERMSLSGEASSDTPLSPRSHVRGLVGASSLATYTEGDDVLGLQSEGRHLGRGASLLDPMETLQPKQYRLNTVLRRTFYRIGLGAALHPWLTFAAVFTAVGLLNLGWKQFQVETDPVRLWVAPNSESKSQKEFFDEHFGPFYRTEQLFITSAHNPLLLTSTPITSAVTLEDRVLSWDTLQYLSDVLSAIQRLRSYPNEYTLTDVCFKPAGPRGACVVQSVMAWFGPNLDGYSEDTWADHLTECANSPVECLPDFQQPLAPEYALGGVPGKDERSRFLDAKALVVTYVVSDSLDPEVQEMAMEWERSLREFLVDLSAKSTTDAGLHISFSTGVSLQEEINKSSNMDVRIVILSYLVMFFYIAFTLGNSPFSREEDGILDCLTRWMENLPKLFSNRLMSSSLSIDSRDTPRIFPRLPRSLFVGSKFTLGLFGIGLVILSVSSSVGLFSLIGVKVTLIIAEVIPFLVLAVGVDNVFILVHELDRQNMLHGPNASSAPPGVGFPTTATIPPRSPFDASTEDTLDAQSLPLHLPLEERVARAVAKMGPSILLSSITETVAFALGALVPMPAVRNFALYAAGSVLLNAFLQMTVFISALTIDLQRVEASRVDCFPCLRLPSRIALSDVQTNNVGLGQLARFVRRHYAPFLLKPVTKGTVLLAFCGVFIASVISIQHIELGLNQRLALPSDSYLIPYFDALDTYFDVGPPVYFVSHDLDVTHRPGQQSLCGRFTTCDEFSVANVLEYARQSAASSFISEPTASWIDDFLRWLDPAIGDCCRLRKRDPSVFCSEHDRAALCRPCYEGKTPAWNITMQGLPEGEEFMRYLRQWISSPTTESCPLAGKASFGSALSIQSDGNGLAASHFRTFHSPLKSQADFIAAFDAAHRIADEISQNVGSPVFPYSIFYVYFDQYAHIISITQEILGLGLASVLVFTALLLGSWRTGTIITGVVALTVVTVMGVMGIWGISLNAISLVNLVISLGIAVEFCAHIARAFMGAGSGLPVDHPAGQKERDERMFTALVDVGPSVLSGITFTKLIGMSVLALTRSKLLEIYYFRMWLTLIISGALHGLVLLPVVLSLAGGPGYALEDADEEWMSNAIRRHDYEYTPFLADYDSATSD